MPRALFLALLALCPLASAQRASAVASATIVEPSSIGPARAGALPAIQTQSRARLAFSISFEPSQASKPPPNPCAPTLCFGGQILPLGAPREAAKDSAKDAAPLSATIDYN